MSKPIKSRRGVYYDLSKSPYRFTTPYGDLFKFSSQKKLDIYTRDIDKELERVDKLIQRFELQDFMSNAALHMLYNSVYRSFYRKIEG